MRSRVEAIAAINEKIYLAEQRVKSCSQGFISHSETIKSLVNNLDNHPGNPKHFTPDQLTQILAHQFQSLFPGGEAVFINAYFDLYVDYLQALRQYGFLAREMILTANLLRDTLTLIDHEYNLIKNEDAHKAFPVSRKSDSAEFKEFFQSRCAWLERMILKLNDGLKYFDNMMSEAAGDVAELPIYRFSVLRRTQKLPEVSHWMKPWYENTKLDEPQRQTFPQTLLKALETLPAINQPVPPQSCGR